MSYIYQADLYCDECGEAIRAELTAAGQAPAEPDDEETYDSDDFPKTCDGREDDTYTLCASGERCANRVDLETFSDRELRLRGAQTRYVGVLATEELSGDGAENYQQSLRELVKGDTWQRALAAYLQSELGELEVTHPALTVEVDGSQNQGETFHEPGEELSVRIVNPDAEQGYDEANGPLSWMNSARITVDPDEDAVHFVLSIEDPRGGLCFTVRRIQSGDRAGQIVIHCPHPAKTLQHVGIAEDHAGTLVVVDERGGEPRRF